MEGRDEKIRKEKEWEGMKGMGDGRVSKRKGGDKGVFK